MKLVRTSYEAPGVFGELRNDVGTRLFYTLEYSDENLRPKVPAGHYVCKWTNFSKHGWKYQVLDVPGHTAIMFHEGNWEKDTDGCILLSQEIVDLGKGKMLINSKKALAEFHEMLKGIDSFPLEVIDGQVKS